MFGCDHGLEPVSGIEGNITFSGRKQVFDFLGYDVTTLIVVAIDFEKKELLAHSDPFELNQFDSDSVMADSASFSYYMILAEDTYKPIINISQFWVVGLTIPLDHFLVKYRPDKMEEDQEIEEGDIIFWADYSSKVNVDEHAFTPNVNFSINFAESPPNQPGE